MRQERQRDGELERLRAQLEAKNRLVAELQAANAELRQFIGSGSSGAASNPTPNSGSPQDVATQLGQAKVLLAQREAEVAALRDALAQRDGLDAQLRGQASGAGGPAGQRIAAEVVSLRQRVGELGAELASQQRHAAEVQVQNASLRAQLSAIDPSFWEDLDTMKRQHRELSQTVWRYEQKIVELSGRLGIPPELRGRGVALGPGLAAMAARLGAEGAGPSRQPR